LYTLPRDVYGGDNKDNECFNEGDYKAEDGLQNISPCQYGKFLGKQAALAAFPGDNRSCLVSLVSVRCAGLHLESTLLPVEPEVPQGGGGTQAREGAARDLLQDPTGESTSGEKLRETFNLF
jgi:hypothetical protein